MEAMNVKDKDKALIDEAVKVYEIPPQVEISGSLPKKKDYILDLLGMTQSGDND